MLEQQRTEYVRYTEREYNLIENIRLQLRSMATTSRSNLDATQSRPRAVRPMTAESEGQEPVLIDYEPTVRQSVDTERTSRVLQHILYSRNMKLTSMYGDVPIPMEHSAQTEEVIIDF